MTLKKNTVSPPVTPTPAVGQVWEDCDRRNQGRRVRLVSLLDNGRWACNRIDKSTVPAGARISASRYLHPEISADRFLHPAGTRCRYGFRFVA